MKSFRLVRIGYKVLLTQSIDLINKIFVDVRSFIGCGSIWLGFKKEGFGTRSRKGLFGTLAEIEVGSYFNINLMINLYIDLINEIN